MTNLLDEDRGSALVEYGLFLTLIGLIVVVAFRGLGVELNNIFI
jgi:Flp pilus assembly pilin Flp